LRGVKKINPLFTIFQNFILFLPTPRNITIIWNFGSLLGVCLIVQILSGLFLAIHYASDVSVAFYRVNHIMRDVQLGWIFRCIHANGARFFFICIYLHIARGIYYGSYTIVHVWLVGCSILLLTIATAFLGYVLPWGQISFWGATVITNLFSAIPYVGSDIVFWLWGGFSVDNATLTRFFALHFLLPFIIGAISVLHLFFLHERGSGNPLGTNRDFDKVKFDPFFLWKDVFGFIIILTFLFSLSIFDPWLLGDPENFISANPLVTPVHIQPEWYFLFAYAILRSIPNKLGGVLALFLSVAIFYLLPFIPRRVWFKRNIFLPTGKFLFWVFVRIFILLTWIGARPVEYPYVITGQILTVLYFIWFPIYFYTNRFWSLHI